MHDEQVTVQTDHMPRPNPPRLPGAEDAVALRIRYERLRRGWSTEEVARRMTDAGCPLNQSAVWRIENGEPRRKITLDESLGFARIFETDLSDMMGSPHDAMAQQITDLIERMKVTSEELQQLRRSLVDAVVAAGAATDAPDEQVVQWVNNLLAEFPWIGTVESSDGT